MSPAPSPGTRPVLSVIVPTKDRPATACVTLMCVLQLQGSDVEFVVQDAGSGDELETFVSTVDDGRVRYARQADRPSMVENWNRAIGRAEGDYVVIVGDDDGVMPVLAEAARWARQNDVDAVIWRPLAYWWPDYPNRRRAGWMNIAQYGGRIHVRPAGQDSARLRGASIIGGLPQLYHGLVRRTVLETVATGPAEYVHGLTPDYYAAWLLNLMALNVAIVDLPLTLLGYSQASNTGRRARGALAEHAREYGDHQFNAPLPNEGHANLRVMVADSLLKAAESARRFGFDVSATEKLRRTVVTDALASLVVDNPARMWGTSRLVAQTWDSGLSRGIFLTARAVARDLSHRLRERIIDRVPMSVFRFRGYRPVQAIDVRHAVDLVDADLSQLGLTWDRVTVRPSTGAATVADVGRSLSDVYSVPVDDERHAGTPR